MNLPQPRSIQDPLAEKLAHYVYLLIDPRDGAVFYVGKGKDDSCSQHGPNDDLGAKSIRLADLKAAGLEPRIEILQHGLETAAEALLIEAAAIDLLGLGNLTNIQPGHGSLEFGRTALADLAVRCMPEDADIRHKAILPLSRVLKVLLGAIAWVCLPAISHAIQVGQTEAQVIKELGEPGMKTPLGPKGVIWAYKHGDLIVKGGRVVSVSFRSPEQVATVEREERLAREKAHAERLLEDIERARAAEAQARMIALESRLQAFQQRRHAVLFGNLTLSDSSPSESGGSASAIFSYRKTEETFVETGGGSAIGDSMQSVGGGGGVGLSGRSGYVIPSVEYVVLWLTLDSAAPILDRDMVASVAFTNRISIPPVSYRVSFDQLPRRDGDGPTLRRYRADMLLAPDSLPDAVFARSDGISIKIRGLPVAGQAPTFDLVSSSEIPVAPRR